MKFKLFRVHPLAPSLAAALLLLSACGKQDTPAPAASDTKELVEDHADDQYSEDAAPTHLDPIDIGSFKVEAEYLGNIMDGHFNLHVEGGDVQAVRAWVGDEAATDALVVLAAWEENHYCAHMEMPEAVPAEARLWVELETEDGTKQKGSTPLPEA